MELSADIGMKSAQLLVHIIIIMKRVDTMDWVICGNA